MKKEGRKEKGKQNKKAQKGEKIPPPQLTAHLKLTGNQAFPSLGLLPPACFDVYFMRINKHSFHFGKVFAVMYCQRSQQ